MLFNDDILTQKDKLDFLIYLSFQLKSETSYERTLSKYIDSGIRKEYIRDLCLNAITDIRNGKSPSDALFDNGFISGLEYGILKNSTSNIDLYNSLISIINIIKGNINSRNVVQKAVFSGLITFLLIFLSIPFFQTDIVTLYSSFEQIQGLTDPATLTKEPDIPFLIKYWWSSLIVIVFFFFIYKGFILLFKHLYEHYTHIYYLMFRNVMYQDLISILMTFFHVQKRMSITNAYILLAINSPNVFWSSMFEEINLNIKQGGKASEVFVSYKGILPLEVVNCFIDADETGEVDLYISKAIEFCENKNETINQNIKEYGPTIVNVILLLIVGLSMVAFLKDIMQKGIVDVMHKI